MNPMDLDPVIHAPTRLRIVSLLAAEEEADFAFVRDTLGISDSVMSKHGSALEQAGYVRIRKGHVGKRPKTWFALTETGRAAFQEYVSSLQRIISASGLTVLPEMHTEKSDRAAHTPVRLPPSWAAAVPANDRQ